MLVTATLLSGCATGYGALAGGGAVATVALIAAAASDAPSGAPRAAGAGFLIGALAGAIGGAVASAVIRGRERRSNEDMRMQLHLQRQRDAQAFEERLQQLEAARLSSASSESSAPRKRPGAADALQLSDHVREFSAD